MNNAEDNQRNSRQYYLSCDKSRQNCINDNDKKDLSYLLSDKERRIVMKTRIISTFLTLSLCLVFGCGGGGGTSATSENPSPPIGVSGYAQKGPFINGTSVTIYELNENLLPSGKSYDSQIKDNSGKFSLNDVSFSSKYVKLKAEGFYFNEILGDTSSSQLTLYALSDIIGKDVININLLSHLEKDRLEYLVGQGKTFSEAKKQAQKEILNIFSISKDDIGDSETLDISSDGDDNAILLAISIILQGYRTTSELTELLANISSDIRTDGVLDSSSLGTQLINDAKLINLSNVRTNLVNRYMQLGLAASIPDFEKNVNTFIANTDYVFTKDIQYPQNGPNGPNILFGTKDLTISAAVPASVSDPGSYYDLAADLPLGTSLKIVMRLNSGYPWGLSLISNWNYSEWNGADQTFTSIESGKSCSLRLDLFEGSFTIEYYENNSATPTRTKRITVIPVPTYRISGRVTSGGSALSGVTINLAGSLSGLTETDLNGFYGWGGLSNGIYIITPSASEYTFIPPSLTVEISGSDRTGLNFTAVSTLP